MERLDPFLAFFRYIQSPFLTLHMEMVQTWTPTEASRDTTLVQKF